MSGFSTASYNAIHDYNGERNEVLFFCDIGSSAVELVPSELGSCSRFVCLIQLAVTVNMGLHAAVCKSKQSNRDSICQPGVQ